MSFEEIFDEDGNVLPPTQAGHPDYLIDERCRKERDRFLDIYIHSNTHLTLQETLKIVDDFICNAYFAGGCIASQLVGEEPRDWDIFFKTETALNRAKEWLLEQPHMVLAATDRAITLRGGYQVIVCRWGTPSHMLDRVFDFAHTQCFWTFWGWHGTDYRGSGGGRHLSIDLVAREACKYKRLLPLHGSDIVDQRRVAKFEKRGWTLDHGELEGLKALAKAQL